MPDILFLGTGGGRINLIRQLRGTGGFLIMGKGGTIHADPGPGALFALNSAGIDPLSIGAVISTHAHIDHVHDAPLIIEAMSGYMLKRRGIIIASRRVLEGDENGDRSITLYHQSMAEKIIALAQGQKETVALPPQKKGAPKSAFTITGAPVKHEDESGFGFVIEMDGAKIGYTSDTEYFEGISPIFAGCDVLIANNIKGSNDPYVGHLDSSTTARLFSEAKPKFGIITHLGMKLIESGPEAEAQKIEKASGVKTFAARDGWYFCTDRCGWFKPEKSKKNGNGQERLA